MLVVVMGDPHGDYNTIDKIMQAEEEVELFFTVGDLVDYSGDYFTPTKKLYFTHGNHENYDIIEALDRGDLTIGNLFHLKPDRVYSFTSGGGAFTLVGFGGNFAPSKFYKPKPRGVKGFDFRDGRRHFNNDDVNRAKGLGHVDILITHEAPIPFKREIFDNEYGREMGVAVINEIKESLSPVWHFFGHHHSKRINGNSICMPYPKDGYVIVDTKTWELIWK